MATKRIKMIKPWQMVPAGVEMEFDTPIADLLIRNGRAVAVEPVQAPVPKKTLKKTLKKTRTNGGK